MSLSVFSESMITQNKSKRVTMKMHSHQTHQIATAHLRTVWTTQHVRSARTTSQPACPLLVCVTEFTRPSARYIAFAFALVCPLYIIKHHAMKLYKRATIGGGGLSATYPNHLTLRKGPTLPVGWEAGWMPDSAWPWWWIEKSFAYLRMKSWSSGPLPLALLSVNKVL
jgi:hypothetical protein